MYLLIDSFWRAAAYCLRPGVIVLSLLPLVVVCLAALSLGYFFWDNALDSVRGVLDSAEFVNHGWAWLDAVGLSGIKTMLAPLIVIFAVTPLIVMASLLVVGTLMTPWLVRMVAVRRFPTMLALGAVSGLASLVWALGSVTIAVLITIVTIPLWFVPPLVFVVPSIVWGWLTYRVMAFDVLSAHATDDERHAVLRQHRPVLICMGVLAGCLGAVPSVLWASFAWFAAMFVVLLPVAVWVYTLVFAFASLWFSHYCLAALHAQRAQAAMSVDVVDLELPGVAL